MIRLSLNSAIDPTYQDDLCAPLDINYELPFTPQVLEHISSLGDLRRFDEFVLPRQAVAACLVLPLLEMSVGMPTVTCYGFDSEHKAVIYGNVSLSNYRYNVVRPRRIELMQKKALDGYAVLDGSGRGLTWSQHGQLAELLGCQITDICILGMNAGYVNMHGPTEGLVERVINACVTLGDLTAGRVLFLPPGHGLVAALQATTICGLSEVWPRVIRLGRTGPGAYAVKEVVDPHSLRERGMGLAAQWRTGEAVVVPQRMFDRLIVALVTNGAGDIADELRMLQ